ncbi:dihydroorotase [Lacihabitans sp. LS3-19]|uniref:dihydroorotase n=1 Tax=Lacihabitans sp. LS3-19 TaxID=2487335 RepID=UPI0020CDDBCF|nr:dihydroorotase [Lacihabitans sp. LS3-19]MCP9768425.1 dihydroorotase [Lacihabitans sp. LS3-19]
MNTYLILNAKVINEGIIEEKDVFIKNGIIEKISSDLSYVPADRVIDAKGLFLMPGVIDDQVHFREPGLTHKANIETESKAALAGGTTSFMEMPNTVPNALTQELLEDKYQIAANTSWTNYSFFMGGSNDNYEETMKTDLKKVCGLKLFMGSSTGNMLVDNETTLENIFSNFPGLIATHCEDEATVKHNLEFYKNKYQNEELPYDIHALIRNEDACYLSSSMATGLAKKHNTRLHILHISTSKELELFDNTMPLKDKKITSEVCVHHLYFDAEDYKTFGNKIKCNPAIKHNHRENLMEGLLNDKLDIIATDHAPHTIEEKSKDYWNAPSGLPLIQSSLQVMLDFNAKGKISLEKIVEKMCHAPAECFKIEKRGYIREGYWADLVLVNLNAPNTVSKENILYKAGWSPFEGITFGAKIEKTFISGQLLFDNGIFAKQKSGQRLLFNR